MPLEPYQLLPLQEDEKARIQQKINEYANAQAPAEPHTEEEQLVFRAADEAGRVIAGCVVHIHSWGRAVLAKLWVDEGHRRQGLGSMLIRAAQNAAREKGCYYLCLGTWDFMARPLYEKHGFRVFTVNKDMLMGHVSWSLAKRLDKGIPDYIPTDNTAARRYQVMPGSREDAEIIAKGLEAYCAKVIPDLHDYIPLGKKLVDAEGRLIAAVMGGVDEDDTAEIDGVWVEEPYRNRGLGSYLLGEVERGARENGAHVLFTYGCDWVLGFFRNNGYAVRGELPDYPKGHSAYELEKRL